MVKPDVLFYSMNYAPELTGAGRYSGELTVGLARRGAVVEVVTAPPHYPGWRVRAPYKVGRYSCETLDGVFVIRCPVVLHKAATGIWRLIAPLSFAVSSAPVALWRILTRRPRAVLCVEPTLFAAPVALLAAKCVGARAVLHVQDLEVDAAFAVGHLGRSRALRWLGHGFERLVLRGFDRVVTISDEMARHLAAKGVLPARLSVVRNWVDTRQIYPLDHSNAYRVELSLADDTFVVLYAGQIGPKQALDVVLDAAEALADAPEIVFVVAGEGPAKAALQVRYGHLANVRFLGLQPEDRLNELLNLADCHILPQHPSIKDLVLPSKLGGMLASGKQIVVIADDDCELATFLGAACLRLPATRLAELPGLLTGLASRAAPDEGRADRLRLAKQMNLPSALACFERVLRGSSPAVVPADLVAPHAERRER